MSEVEPIIQELKSAIEIPKKTKLRKREPIMTWGKYKGRLVKDIIQFDIKYASWLYKQEFVSKFVDVYQELDNYFRDV